MVPSLFLLAWISKKDGLSINLRHHTPFADEIADTFYYFLCIWTMNFDDASNDLSMHKQKIFTTFYWLLHVLCTARKAAKEI